jgi:hypothetical protein
MFTFPFHLHQDQAGRAGSGSVQSSLLAYKVGPEKVCVGSFSQRVFIPLKGLGHEKDFNYKDKNEKF